MVLGFSTMAIGLVWLVMEVLKTLDADLQSEKRVCVTCRFLSQPFLGGIDS